MAHTFDYAGASRRPQCEKRWLIRMLIFADLHIHSRWSRATSSDLSLETLGRWAAVKGVNLLGTGDFTHPAWFKELRANLKPAAEERGGGAEVEGSKFGEGIFRGPAGLNFVLQTEVSNIYEQEGRSRKVHNIILAPSFEVAAQINELLAKKGDLSTDGRPILEGYSCPEFVEDMKMISPQIEIIPAHCWTPWFSVFGSKSGFDSLRECFQEQSKHIFAIETGLSSDPAMNWRIPQLDDIALISNSDLHSYWPWRMGREANVFELPRPTYSELIDAIRARDRAVFFIQSKWTRVMASITLTGTGTAM